MGSTMQKVPDILFTMKIRHIEILLTNSLNALDMDN